MATAPCTAGPGHPVEQMLLDQQDPGPRVVEHERQPLRRIGRIERQPGAAGLQDRQHAHHHRRRALGAEADDDIRTDAQLPQVPRQAPGAADQAAVGPALVPQLDGHGVRRPRRLRGDVQMQAALLASPSIRVSFHSTRSWARSASASTGRSATRCRGSARAAASSRSKWPDQAVDGRGVEQIGGVLDRAAGSPPPCSARLSVRSNFAIVLPAPERAQAQVPDLQAPGRSVLQREHHLEQGRCARLRSGASSSTSFSNGTSWCV